MIDQVRFYDKSWAFIGVKNEEQSPDGEILTDEISRITTIEAWSLRSSAIAGGVCAAVKMSWMARRETTRAEDLAYALMGLFDVNMPLLYGEGHKAFRRLQLEIIKQSEDDSIFAHSLPANAGSIGPLKFDGILANGPWSFMRSGNVRTDANPLQARIDLEEQWRPPYSTTNRGLALHLAKTEVASFRDHYPYRDLEYRLKCVTKDPGNPPCHILIWLAYSDAWGTFRVQATKLGPSPKLHEEPGHIETQCIYVQL